MTSGRDRLADALASRAEVLYLHGRTIDDVLLRAGTIRRRRRIATGVAAAAVVAGVAPVAVFATNALDGNDVPPPVPVATAGPTPEPATSAEYVVGGVWHRADGRRIALPRKDYSGAVSWNTLLVATYWDGEAFSIADVIDQTGKVVESFGITAPVVVDEHGTTMAWIGTDGTVMTRWDDGRLAIGHVSLSAAGEGVTRWATVLTGGPDCHEPPAGDGCTVQVESGVGEPTSFDSHGVSENPVPGALAYSDASNVDGHLLSVVNKRNEDTSTCGGLYDLDAGRFRFETCEFAIQQISPQGNHVAAPPSMYDGDGVTSISVLDAVTGEEAARYDAEGGHVAAWAWSNDSRLLFDLYDGTNWHLMAMTTDGEIEELSEPVKSPDRESPFLLIQN